MSRAAPDEAWLRARTAAAARALRRAVSATDLVRRREPFGWTVRPAPGSILASPRCALREGEPDYFHHWVRDAALALRAAPHALKAAPEAHSFWRQAVADHIRFSLAISDPRRRGPEENPLAASTRPSHRRFLRPDRELAALKGERWLEEPRFAPDGGPDLERWSRPQDDGPALRASALMEVLRALPELAGPEAERLIERDLDHAARVAGRPCIGPWEEPPPRRTAFTLIVQWDALDRGAARARARGRSGERLSGAAARIAAVLRDAADPATGGWRESVGAAPGDPDSAAILGILHAGRADGPLALAGDRTRATAAALEAVFRALYPLNHGRAVPAIGRWRGDVYCGGNPWYAATLGFAELHYRIAALTYEAAAFEKAEAWMALIQEVAPEGDDLPEQFDRATGAPASCLALTWSSAAFLGAAAAREAALQAPVSG